MTAWRAPTWSPAGVGVGSLPRKDSYAECGSTFVLYVFIVLFLQHYLVVPLSHMILRTVTLYELKVHVHDVRGIHGSNSLHVNPCRRPSHCTPVVKERNQVDAILPPKRLYEDRVTIKDCIGQSWCQGQGRLAEAAEITKTATWHELELLCQSPWIPWDRLLTFNS